MKHARLLILALAVLPLSASVHAGGASAASPLPPERDCLRQLAERRGPEIACEHPAWLTVEERADLRRLTRERLQDAGCLVKVRITRQLVDDALASPDSTFEAPPQPVTCEIKTRDGAMTITGSFAPRVVFKAGRAVEATPGLANVEGVNAYLAWPVVQYVNRAPGIQAQMIEMINAWLEGAGRRRAAQR